MRNIFALLIAFTLGTTGSLAQTIISNYKPGVTSEGAVYYLPKTAIRITLQVETRKRIYPTLPTAYSPFFVLFSIIPIVRWTTWTR